MSRGSVEGYLDTLIRDIPDFPKTGVLFKDITPLLADHDGFTAIIEALADAGRDASGTTVVDKVIGMEARGFILAAPVALALGVGFVPVRKAGKLPAECYTVSYELEYGEATLEMHTDALTPGERVLLVDDVLAHRRHCGGDPEDGRVRRGRGDRARRPDGAVVPARTQRPRSDAVARTPHAVTPPAH
ncbi:adenine phosphoribosyltransferase [Marmoricola sp. OAE513]